MMTLKTDPQLLPPLRTTSWEHLSARRHETNQQTIKDFLCTYSKIRSWKWKEIASTFIDSNTKQFFNNNVWYNWNFSVFVWHYYYDPTHFCKKLDKWSVLRNCAQINARFCKKRWQCKRRLILYANFWNEAIYGFDNTSWCTFKHCCVVFKVHIEMIKLKNFLYKNRDQTPNHFLEIF